MNPENTTKQSGRKRKAFVPRKVMPSSGSNTSNEVSPQEEVSRDPTETNSIENFEERESPSLVNGGSHIDRISPSETENLEKTENCSSSEIDSHNLVRDDSHVSSEDKSGLLTVNTNISSIMQTDR